MYFSVSACLSVCMSICLSVSKQTVARSVCLSVCLSNERPTCLLSVYLSIELSISLLVCLSIYVYLFACLTAFGRACSGFCPRVPVHKSRYKGPNNTQQLTNDLLNKKIKNNAYSLVNPYTRIEPCSVSVNRAASVPVACHIFNL